MSQKMQQKSDNKSGNSPEINHKIIKPPSPEEANSKEPASQDYISHLFSYTSAVGGAETTSERFSSLLTGPGLSHPANSTPRNQTFIQMQQTFGNHYVQRMVEKSRNSSQEPGTRIQAKLKIGQPNDIYEQEADRIADQVMRMPEPKESLVQRKSTCPECIEEEELQMKQGEGHTPTVTPKLHDQISSLCGGGQPLPGPDRSFFEPRFGHSFSGVQVHTGTLAAETARAVNAKAFTLGQDIVFGAGQFAPDSQEGKQLLAHELAHVVQQSNSRHEVVQRGKPEEPRPQASYSVTSIAEAIQLGETEVIGRIGILRAELAAGEGDMYSQRQELANFKQALIFICATRAGGFVNAVSGGDLLFVKSGTSFVIVSGSDFLVQMTALDAESITSCEAAEQSVLSELFPGAGASIESIQVAHAGTPEHGALRAYQAGDFTTVSSTVQSLLPTGYAEIPGGGGAGGYQEHADPLVGPTQGGEGAAAASEVETLEREFDERGLDTVEKVRTALAQEVTKQHKAAGVSEKDTGDAAMPAMAGGTMVLPRMLLTVGEGGAEIVSARAATSLAASAPVIFALAVGLGVLIYTTHESMAQDAVRQGLVRIRLLQARLAALLAAAGTILKVTEEDKAKLIEKWWSRVKAIKELIKYADLEIECDAELRKLMSVFRKFISYMARDLETMVDDDVLDLDLELEDALDELEDCLERPKSGPPDSEPPGSGDGEPVPLPLAG